jgi:hypothetical protein
LPKVEGIRFLATVGDIVEEGRRMRHCIATHIPLAVTGQSFLFHVEYRGEEASIEVGADGQIVQTAGPGNSHNEAAEWGERQLRRWLSGCE